MLWAVACAIVGALAGVLLLGISGWFLTGAAIAGAGGPLAVRGFNYLLPSAFIRLLAIARTGARYGERLWGHAAALRTLSALRATLFGVMLRTADPRRISAADSVTRLTNDVETLEERLIRKPAGLGAVAGALAGVALAATAGWMAASALAALLVGLVLAVRWLAPLMMDDKARQVGEALGALKSSFMAQAAASAEIAAFGLGNRVAASLLQQAAVLDTARRKLARAEAQLGMLAVAAGGVAMAAMLLLSDVGAPFTVLAMLGAAGAVEAMGGLLRAINRDRMVDVALDRIAALADQEVRTVPVSDSDTLDIEGSTFSPGARVAILGASGSGKTRLLETLAGLRQGEGQPTLFAVSPQGSDLLSGTVRDNLALAHTGLSEDAMWAALETAAIATDVRALPGGLDCWIGDSGERLSGGQRKRLALARALLAGRPWLVLDEPTEGLDAATEALVVRNIRRWVDQTGAGLLIASHRAAPLELASQSISMDKKKAP